MTVLFLTADLMFASRAQMAASRQGVQLVTVGEADKALEACQQAEFARVLLDLTLPDIDPAALVPQLRSVSHPPREIVAYAPHVHEARLAAAQQAGCDRVLTRGQFNSQLDTFFAP